MHKTELPFAVLLRGSPLEMLQRLMSMSLTALIIVVLVDPSNKILHAKVLIFCSVFCFWAAIKLCSGLTLRRLSIALWALVIAVAIPSISLVTGLLENKVDDPLIGLIFFKAYLFFLILIPVVDQNVLLDRFAGLTGIIVVITMAVFAIAIVMPDVFAAVYQFSMQKENLMISSRDLGFGMFYYKTSSSIVFLLASCLRKREDGKRQVLNLFLALCCSFALLLSGTRANAGGACLIVMFYGFRWVRKAAGRTIAFGMVIVLSTISIVYVANHWFTGEGNEDSDNIKRLHLLAYEDIFSQHPETLFIGEGIGSKFRSKGAEFYSGDDGEPMYDSELTYFELIRELGIPLALIVVGAFLAPVYLIYRRGMYKARSHLVIAYLTYLAIAGSNPLLISSTGILIAVCMYSSALWTRQTSGTVAATQRLQFTLPNEYLQGRVNEL